MSVHSLGNGSFSTSFEKLKQCIDGEKSSATFACGGTIGINSSETDVEKVCDSATKLIQEQRITC